MKKFLITLIIAVNASNSFAYYQAQQGRWMSRDPIDDKGSQLIREKTALNINLQSLNIHPYQFLWNNTPNVIDAYGLDITLTTGNKNAAWWQYGNRFFHQEICVDTWIKDKDNPCCLKKGPRKCYSFAAFGFGFQKPSKDWLGQPSPQLGGPLRGEVYCTGDQGRKNSGSITTTCEQDKEFLSKLQGLDGTPGTYSLGRHSCRTFSQMMFEEAQNSYGNSGQQPSGKCKCPVTK